MADEDPLSRRELLGGKLFRHLRESLADAVASRLQAFEELGSELQPKAAKPPNESLVDPAHLPLLQRPPGAIDEEMFLDQCTRCGDCIEACPPSAILAAPEAFGRAAGTPIIDPRIQACVMCTDTPCIASCEPDVLRDDLPLTMGSAMIVPSDCLAFLGQSCTQCTDACPVTGALDLTDGLPSINNEHCTGCGVCHQVCPAPVNAVIMRPAQDRPIPPPSDDAKKSPPCS
ncbi:MAG: 4Fe-4S binding protein [Phycisphaerales bacterium]|nr:4Fe-4S binding protein [Phycisphaerales bacterium]